MNVIVFRSISSQQHQDLPRRLLLAMLCCSPAKVARDTTQKQDHAFILNGISSPAPTISCVVVFMGITVILIIITITIIINVIITVISISMITIYMLVCLLL